MDNVSEPTEEVVVQEEQEVVENSTPISETNDSFLTKGGNEQTTTTEEVVENEEKGEVIDQSYTNMKDFIKTLDPKIQENSNWQKFKTPQDLAKSYIELQSLVGKKGDIPKTDAPPEEWTNFYKKLGMPDTVEGYEITLPEELQDGSARFNKALELAHEAGLSKFQANKLFKGLIEMEKGELVQFSEIQSETMKEEESKLHSAWGNAMEEMIDSVTRFEKSFGVYELFENKGLNADADLLIMLGKLSERLGEDPTIKTNMANTPTGIDNEISELNSQIKDFLRRGEKIPKHLMDRRTELYNKRYRD